MAEAGHRRGWRRGERKLICGEHGSQEGVRKPFAEEAGHRRGCRGEPPRTPPAAGEVAHVFAELARTRVGTHIMMLELKIMHMNATVRLIAPSGM